jgi:ribosome-binding protein aMBF1 (putative translation factor)
MGFILVPVGSDTVWNLANRRFRELLVEARQEASLSQAQLSARLKRPQSFVSKYERGERRLDVIEFGEVARALGIDPAKLLAKLYRETACRSSTLRRS